MLKITSFRINHQLAGDTLRSHFSATDAPVFSWAVESSHDHNRQFACKITVSLDDEVLWDSGFVTTHTQQLAYDGPALPRGTMLNVAAVVKDCYHETSDPFETFFYLSTIDWVAPWIASPVQRPRTDALYFRKNFTIDKPVASANLYACGIGYQRVLLNGLPLDEGPACETPLDPAVTDYSKEAQYIFYPDVQELLGKDNCLSITVGLGWRDNIISTRVDTEQHGRVCFRGDPILTAMLILFFEDGTSQTIVTDDSWTCCGGPITYNDIFNGITYDARLYNPHHDLHPNNCCHCDECQSQSEDDISTIPFDDSLDAPNAIVKYQPDGYGKLVPMYLPPIAGVEERAPIAQWHIGETCYFDFGQNIAGVIRLRIPEGLPEGTKITLSHSEELNENGELYTVTLRSAKATDTYIASGNEDDDTYFQPMFTYHGFRYASINGLGPVIDNGDVTAVSLRNDLDKKSFFTSGSPLINKIHDNCLETERANTHGLLTDCPQRDERMGWLNDATVRFEAFPYAFEADAIFTKIIQDIIDQQSEEGGISCTAPFVFGSRPADPVCASFIIAGEQALLNYGDANLIQHAFEGFRKWADCLLAHSDDGIVNYTCYGDWAAPAYACDRPNGAHSAVTPGIFMSTGYSFYASRAVGKMARFLGMDDVAQTYEQQADFIKNAMLDKWYDKNTKLFATGSMACIIFPLWLGIYPKEDAEYAAQKLRDDLVAADYRFTTGNLCTRYLFEVLSDYGYVDTAYELIQKDTYPSFGFMIQQEATTIWERFELKKDGGMNSHSHPMYGAVYHWFYAYLAGINFTENACEKVAIKPVYPEKLQSVHCSVDTVKGPVTVRWFKRYDSLNLHVTVPFGMTANVDFNGQTHVCGSGFHAFMKEIKD